MKVLPSSDFLMLPNKMLVSSIRKLKPTEFILLVILFYISQRLSTDKFYYSDKQIIEKFGISQASITRARKVLKQLQLIDYKQGFTLKAYSRATRYQLLPSKKLRKKYRIRNQKDELYKPP